MRFSCGMTAVALLMLLAGCSDENPGPSNPDSVATWREEGGGRLPSHTLFGVWGMTDSEVFAVGGGGTILHYDGDTWSAMTSGTSADLLGVWGSSGSDVYAVGEGGTIRHWNGSSWSAETSGTTSWLFGVWGWADNDVFVVGQGPPTTLHYDGSDWSEMAGDIGGACIWGTSGRDVYAARGSVIAHYQGNTWMAMDSGLAPHISVNGVWGTEGNDVFAVGTEGSILHYGGVVNPWRAMGSGTDSWLNGVWGSAGDNVFVVGNNGTILHYDGSAWSPLVSGTTGQLFGVWGSSGSDVFAVGTGGTILHYSR